MKKLYFLVPIVAVVIFYFFYAAIKADLQKREEDRKADIAAKQAERAKNDVEIRKAAFQLAFAEAERKIAQIRLREEEDKRKSEETQAAKDARDLVYRERERQYKRLMELNDAKGLANEQLASVNEHLKLQRIQADSLRTTSQEVMQNKATYEQALNKMEAAEKQIIAQQAAERAAAAKKS